MLCILSGGLWLVDALSSLWCWPFDRLMLCLLSGTGPWLVDRPSTLWYWTLIGYWSLISLVLASDWLVNCLHLLPVSDSYWPAFSGLWLADDLSSVCLQASGWLLSCLQNPTAVHLYVVPSHTKPGIVEKFLHDLQVHMHHTLIFVKS